ncbi:MAG: lytic transglycosylase domain-containing protein [Clostridium perfringens]|nr:lytic transglycosylase domain-containing protein [Clostridium perfringens]
MRKFLTRLIVIVLAIYLVFLGSTIVLKNVIFPRQYLSYVEQYSAEYDLSPNLVYAVIKTESNFNPDAQSDAGAIGLMQITNSTGEWIAGKIGVDNYSSSMLKDPETSIEFGCWYLEDLYQQFGNWDLVIAAYNAGRGNVDSWLSSGDYSKDGNLSYIPFGETDQYVKKVDVFKQVYDVLYGNNY